MKSQDYILLLLLLISLSLASRDLSIENTNYIIHSVIVCHYGYVIK